MSVSACYPNRSASNYRSYTPESQQRVELIQRALNVGFSLSELKTVLAARDRGQAPCLRVRELLHSKIADLNRQIEHLLAMRRHLNRLAKDWDDRLRVTRKGERAYLLERMQRKCAVRIAQRPRCLKNRNVW
jgi:DNA-binding transcriptional MerR regulator